MAQRIPSSLFDLLDKVLRDLATGQGGKRVSIGIRCSDESAARALGAMLVFANDWNDETKTFMSPETRIGTFTTIVGAPAMDHGASTISTEELLQRHKFRYDKSDKEGQCHLEIISSNEDAIRWKQHIHKMMDNLAILKSMVFEGRLTEDDRPIIINKESELAASADKVWKVPGGKQSAELAEITSYVTMRLEEYHVGYKGEAALSEPESPGRRRSRPIHHIPDIPEPEPFIIKQRRKEQKKRQEKRSRQQEKRQAEISQEIKNPSGSSTQDQSYKPQAFALPKAQASLTNFQDAAKRWNGTVMQDALDTLARSDMLDINIGWQKELAEMLIGPGNLYRVMATLGIHKAFFGNEPSGNRADANIAQVNKEWLAENSRAVTWLQDHAAAIPGLNLLLAAALYPSTKHLDDTAKALRKEYGGVNLDAMREFSDYSQQILQKQLSEALGRKR